MDGSLILIQVDKGEYVLGFLQEKKAIEKSLICKVGMLFNNKKQQTCFQS